MLKCFHFLPFWLDYAYSTGTGCLVHEANVCWWVLKSFDRAVLYPVSHRCTTRMRHYCEHTGVIKEEQQIQTPHYERQLLARVSDSPHFPRYSRITVASKTSRFGAWDHSTRLITPCFRCTLYSRSNRSRLLVSDATRAVVAQAMRSPYVLGVVGA